MKNEIQHLSHSSYRCQYHIVFAPKYRRKEIYGKIKKDIGEILRKLCTQKGVEIIPRFYRGKIKASAKKKGRALSKPKSVEKQLNLQV